MQQPLIDKNDFPHPSLVFLLDLLGLSHDYSLESIVRITQKEWLQNIKERWHFDPREEHRLHYMFPLLRNLGCIEAITPKEKNYDYALVLGGYHTRAKMRLAELIREWESGVHFRRIVFLTGERYLDPETEKEYPGKTETDLMLHLWEKLTPPPSLKNLPLVVVDTPGSKNSDGTWRRPTTKDTVVQWLNTSPKSGTCLAISSQPFVGYQHSVLSTHLPTVETVGPYAEDHLILAVYLDNLARWLYQECTKRSTCAKSI